MEDAGQPLNSAPRRLAQVEVCDLEGRCLQLADVWRWPLRVGRALDNDLVLPDPHVAAHHATLLPAADGSLLLRVENSRNGARLDRGRSRTSLATGEQAPLGPGTWVDLGHSLLRVRRVEDALADELPMALPPHAPWHGWTPALAGATLAGWLATLWLQNTPDSKALDYLAPTVAAAGGVGVWAFGWGLAGKLFTGRFTLLPHLRWVLAYVLAIGAADLALAILAFALDWPWADRVRPLVGALLVSALVAQHLCLVVPLRARAMRLLIAAVTSLALLVQGITQWQRSDRLLGELYASALMPPMLRLVRGKPVQSLTAELRTLEQPLRERALKAQAEDFEP